MKTSGTQNHTLFTTSTLGGIECYRFGFNGMEMDNEWKGEGNHYTTEWRQYDPRLGRFMSLDPVMRKYPGWSPYNFSFNNPIWWNDPDGDDPNKEKDPETLKEGAEKGVEAATEFHGNTTSPACNIGVRTAVKHAAGTSSLYPSWLGGEVSGDGTANTISKSLEEGKISDFVKLEDQSFENIQKLANEGVVIVGTFTGWNHIVMAVPGQIEDGYPQVMETGRNHRESQTPLNTNVRSEHADKIIWYAYKPHLEVAKEEDVIPRKNYNTTNAVWVRGFWGGMKLVEIEK